jgi:hypothetical protein
LRTAVNLSLPFKLITGPFSPQFHFSSVSNIHQAQKVNHFWQLRFQLTESQLPEESHGYKRANSKKNLVYLIENGQERDQGKRNEEEQIKKDREGRIRREN